MLLFLGAGASKPFGIPAMFDFVRIFDEEFKDNELYNKTKETFSEKEFDLEVLMTILEDLSKTKEEFFRVVSPQTTQFLFKIDRKEAEHYVNESVIKENAKKLLTRMKSIIRRECVKAIKEKETRIMEVYDEFFQTLSQIQPRLLERGWEESNIARTDMNLPSNLQVFTTNYDTCLETYLNRKQIEYTRGIVYRYGENFFDVSSYNEIANKIGIFKLHGSIDLFQKKDQIRQLPILNEDITYLGNDIGEESIRWPIEFGGYRHVIESPYLDLFRLLRDKIKDEHWWIIIGSSLRDRTICSILNDVLRLKEKRERPTILLINRNPEPVVQRLRDWEFLSFADSASNVKVEFGSKGYPNRLLQIFPS